MINRAQMKIMQMAFMIVAVFFLFVLVGLFLLGIISGDIKQGAGELQAEEAISSLMVIAGMSELNCDASESLCLDEDKLKILTGNKSSAYEDFWPVASVKAYKIYPAFDEVVECPGLGCNYYEIYDGEQDNVKEYSTYVSICKKVKDSNYVYDSCVPGKLVVGAITYE